MGKFDDATRAHERGEFAEALALFGELADSGDPASQANLATMLREGEGADVDLPRARQLFRQAAQQGNAVACIELGILLANGQGGEPDPIQAARWVSIGWALGEEEARPLLDDLNANLTPGQQQQVKDECDLWFEAFRRGDPPRQAPPESHDSPVSESKPGTREAPRSHPEGEDIQEALTRHMLRAFGRDPNLARQAPAPDPPRRSPMAGHAGTIIVFCVGLLLLGGIGVGGYYGVTAITGAISSRFDPVEQMLGADMQRKCEGTRSALKDLDGFEPPRRQAAALAAVTILQKIEDLHDCSEEAALLATSHLDEPVLMALLTATFSLRALSAGDPRRIEPVLNTMSSQQVDRVLQTGLTSPSARVQRAALERARDPEFVHMAKNRARYLPRIREATRSANVEVQAAAKAAVSHLSPQPPKPTSSSGEPDQVSGSPPSPPAPGGAPSRLSVGVGGSVTGSIVRPLLISINKRQTELEGCLKYFDIASKGPSLMRLTIFLTGPRCRVQTVALTHPTGNQRFDRCIRNKFKSWTVPTSGGCGARDRYNLRIEIRPPGEPG